MKIENQVCTMEQAKKLKELGVYNPTPEFYWVDLSAWSQGYKIQHKSEAEYRSKETKDTAFTDFNTTFPAFTVPELGVVIPNEQAIIGWEIWYNDHIGEWNCAIRDFVKWKEGANPPPIAYESEGNTMAEAMANALIHCLENKSTTVEECNHRLLTA